MVQNPWWKGKRGEWYVVIQIAFIVLVFLGPRTWFGVPTRKVPYAQAISIVGGVIFLSGLALLLAGLFKLGKNLTPVPYPTQHATLITAGPYRWVRHPMYCGGIFMAFGWALWVRGWLTIGYAIIMVVFLDIKSRREERWLGEKFSGYVDYQKRVRKLIPFVY